MQPDAFHIERWHTEDVDQQSGRLSGWDQEYRQTSCGRFTGRLVTAQGAGLTVIREHTSQSLHQKVVAPAGQLVFGWAIQHGHAVRVNRRPVAAGALIVLEGGREYDFRTEGATELLGVCVEEALCRERGGERHALLLRDAVSHTVLELDGRVAAQLRPFWSALAGLLGEAPARPGATLRAGTAVDHLLLALAGSARQPVPPMASERQARVVGMAIRTMRACLHQDLQIADLCAATHVSERTLRYHFEQCLHMSPQQYLKVLRLNAARGLLRALGGAPGRAPRQLNIAEIAAECGYAHASRFAGDYRRQFGALPSDTLRAAAAGRLS